MEIDVVALHGDMTDANEEHIRRTYDKPLQLNSKKTQFQKRNSQRIQQILYKCKSMNCQLAHENALSCTSHQGMQIKIISQLLE